MEKNNYKYKVAVRCMTYNQAHYIEDALRGFALQETTFPVVNIIVDDASTDGEQDVIKIWAAKNLEVDGVDKWREMPYGLLMEASLCGNCNSLFVILLLSENHYQAGRSKMRFEYIAQWIENAKYQALCEGDDYWIDNYKLQKQVDFMDAHHDYGLCHTDYIEYIQETGQFSYKNRNCGNGDVMEALLKGGFYIASLTSLFRTEDYERISLDYNSCGFLMGDLPLWIELSRISKFYYLPDKTSCYRVLSNSASHSISRLKKALFHKNVYEVRAFFINRYRIDSLREENERSLYYHSAIVFALQRKSYLAFRAFFKSHHFSFSEILFFISRFFVQP